MGAGAFFSVVLVAFPFFLVDDIGFFFFVGDGFFFFLLDEAVVPRFFVLLDFIGDFFFLEVTFDPFPFDRFFAADEVFPLGLFDETTCFFLELLGAGFFFFTGAAERFFLAATIFLDFEVTTGFFFLEATTFPFFLMLAIFDFLDTDDVIAFFLTRFAFFLIAELLLLDVSSLLELLSLLLLALRMLLLLLLLALLVLLVLLSSLLLSSLSLLSSLLELLLDDEDDDDLLPDFFLDTVETFPFFFNAKFGFFLTSGFFLGETFFLDAAVAFFFFDCCVGFPFLPFDVGFFLDDNLVFFCFDRDGAEDFPFVLVTGFFLFFTAELVFFLFPAELFFLAGTFFFDEPTPPFFFTSEAFFLSLLPPPTGSSLSSPSSPLTTALFRIDINVFATILISAQGTRQGQESYERLWNFTITGVVVPHVLLLTRISAIFQE